MSDFARWAVVAEMLALVFAIGGVAAAQQVPMTAAPKWVKLLIGSVLWVLFGGVSAIIINAFSPAEATDGVKFLAVFAFPSAVAAAAAVVMAVRRPPLTAVEKVEQQVIRNAKPIAQMLVHLPHAEPCSDPYCTDFRAGMLQLTDQQPTR